MSRRLTNNYTKYFLMTNICIFVINITLLFLQHFWLDFLIQIVSFCHDINTKT
jgi:hypothetical protein